MQNIVFYLIEFLDELVFGVLESAKPFIKADINLSYTQIGLLVFIPGLVSSFVEPILGILGDTWKRKKLIILGGVFFCVAVIFSAVSRNFFLLLLSSVLFFPASGAFVTLSQASLMDTNPERSNQNMARWTLAGSIGVVVGPLLLGGMMFLGGTWRILLILIAIIVLIPLWHLQKKNKLISQPIHNYKNTHDRSFLSGIKQALIVGKDRNVMRWLVLLEFSDLLLDVFLGFLALYLVEIGLMKPVFAVLGISVWTGVGLLGNFLLIPLLEKVKGLDYLLISVIFELILFPLFLLISNPTIKLILLGLLGFFNSGWYAILKGELYNSMPGKSGTVMTLSNLSGSVGRLLPLMIGVTADRFGLANAMWILYLGPIALLIGLPKRNRFKKNESPSH